MRRVAMVITAGMVGSLLIGLGGARAAEPPTTVPTILSPTEGATVADLVPVSVSTEAALVQIRFTRQATGDSAIRRGVADGGVATLAFDSLGFYGTTQIAARDCVEEAGTFCGPWSAPVSVLVNNAPPVLTTPSGDVLISSSKQLVPVVVNGPTRGNVFWQVGANGPIVADGTAPYRKDLDVSTLPNGSHQLKFEHCTSSNTMCTNWLPGPTVHVCRPGPTLQRLDGHVISPNGDGVNDLLPVSFVTGCDASYRWWIEKQNGDRVIESRDFNDGDPVVGSQRLDLDLAPSHVGLIADGTYKLVLETQRHIADLDLPTSRNEVEFRLDTKPPATPAWLTAGPRALFPRQDGYRDFVTVRSAAVAGSTARLEVVGPGGDVVDTKFERSWPASYFAWSGRDVNGRLVPEGAYSLRLTQIDDGGNESTPIVRTVTVSHKRLVRRTIEQTYPARPTVTQERTRRCGAAVRDRGRPGWSGSVRYDIWTCPNGLIGRASTRNEISLPQRQIDGFGTAYRRVQLSMLGAAAPGRDDYAAEVLTSLPHAIGSWGHDIGPAKGWHSLGAVHGRRLDEGHRLRWGIWVSGSSYDVWKYRVRATYWSLE